MSQKDEAHAPRSVFFSVHRDGLTGALQLNVGNGSAGYRLAGPKYCGHSKLLLSCELTPRDAEELRSYLDAAFPPAVQMQRPWTAPDGS